MLFPCIAINAMIFLRDCKSLHPIRADCKSARTNVRPAECCFILVSGENPEHLYLCAYYSAFLTINCLRGLTQKSRRDERPQTGGVTPGNVATTEKAPRGRQNYNWFVDSILRTLSPRRGFFCCRTTTGGLHPRLWSFAPPVLFPGHQ